MSYVTFAQTKDASAFKTLVEETLAEKVVMVLEALKVEVASQFFNEEGGLSGGVSSVKKKPTPPAAGSVKLPGEGGKEGGLEHAGRSSSSGGEKTGDAVLPGQATHAEGMKCSCKGDKKNPDCAMHGKKKMSEATMKSHGKLKFKAVQKDKAPKMPQSKGSGSAEDRKSMD
jgi:hypothetical protein